MASQETQILDVLEEEGNKSQTVGPDSVSDFIRNNKMLASILHLNIRGIKTNFEHFLVFLETYSLSEIDVIVLSECHYLETVAQFNITNFTAFYNNTNFNSYDGLVVFIKSDLNPIFENFKLPVSGITITKISLNVKNTQIHIYAIYRSPSSNTNIFLDEMRS